MDIINKKWNLEVFTRNCNLTEIHIILLKFRFSHYFNENDQNAYQLTVQCANFFHDKLGLNDNFNFS